MSSWVGVVTIAALLVPIVRASAPGEALRFHHYTQEDGLTQNSVRAIAQDDRGFLWFGTEDGLHRFDGFEMLVYQAVPGDESGLLADAIQHLLLDSKGNLWIATYGGGLSRLEVDSGQFTHFRSNPNDHATLRSNYPFRLAEHPDGRIWVLSEKGIDLLDPFSGNVQRFIAGDESGLGTDDAWSVYVDRMGRVWAGMHDGLYLFDGASNKFSLFQSDDTRYSAFHDHTVTAISETRDGQLLVATRTGINRLDQQLELVAHQGPESFGMAPDESLRILRILPTRHGELWVSLYDRGVFWWDETRQRFRNHRHDPSDRWSLSDDVVLSMFEDRTGVVWFGTETGGVNKFNSATRAFKYYRHRKNQPNSLPNRVVWAVLEDRQGNLWIGTDGGLSKLDRQRDKYTHYFQGDDERTGLSSSYVISLMEDSGGDIWVGTYSGLNRLDPETGVIRRYRLQSESINEEYANAISFVFEAEGALWVGTGAGLFHLDPTTGEHEQLTQLSTAPGGLPSNFLTMAAPARSGGWWIGTEYGAVLFDPATREFGEVLNAGTNERLSHRYIMDILEARDGTLWVATDYKLNRLAPDGSSDHIGVEEGFPSNTVYSLLEDGQGDLWIGTNNGLVEYNPASKSVRVFDAMDGLQSNEFNGGARFRSSSGELFFGGINGLNAFYPSQVGRQTEPPSAAITHFFKTNDELTQARLPASGDRIDLSWRDTMIGFEFAVFDYAAPSKNQYRYRLDGFDKQWVTVTGHRRVTYTNLDAGEYVFRVQGANRHGVWADEEINIAVTVEPAPWHTWWAYTIYALIGIVLVSLGLRFHFVRLGEKHQLESEQQKRRWAETLQQLTQALASSLNGNEVAEELLENLRAMVAFRKAVLFVEQGVEIHVAGAKGVRDDQNGLLEAIPTTYSRFFADIRHARSPRTFTRHDIHMSPLHDEMSNTAEYLAVPAFSRADEFALLFVGRDAPPFSEQETDIVSAFLTQAMVSIDNARLFAEVQNLATTDTLTQVHNRRYFFELAELEFSRGKRYQRDMSLILLDADNFKAINDQYGREIGDRALKIIANCCRNNLRHFDIIGRFGGEDFVIVLPETPLNVAADVADRLRKSIESVRLDTHKGEVHITVSVGVAVASSEVLDLPALINRADVALYEAKRGGRNKVVVAEI